MIFQKNIFNLDFFHLLFSDTNERDELSYILIFSGQRSIKYLTKLYFFLEVQKLCQFKFMKYTGDYRYTSQREEKSTEQ